MADETTGYESIFDGATIITKRDLCTILNLNLNRTNLNFTANEIKQAYRKRALRCHPDKQNQFDPALPNEMCKGLMSDIELARDYLLHGEDNIPGKAFKATEMPHEKEDIMASAIHGLNSFKENVNSIQSSVYWLNLASSSFFALIPFATYSDRQLNLRYINIFSEQLAAIRPYIKDIDGTVVAQFLRFLRDEANKEGWDSQLAEFLNNISPELVTDLKKQNQLELLIQGIKESRAELKNLLTDEFIKKIQNIISFWPQFIASVPTWKHLGGVFFMAMLFTATSLPKFLNAFKVISETIIQHKGVLPFVMVVFPLLATSLLLLPLNIAINMSQTLAWQTLKACTQIITNGLALLASLFNLMFMLNPTSNKVLSIELFKIFEASFNIFIRLPLIMSADILNAATFILTNNHLLTFLSEGLNNALSDLLNLIRPQESVASAKEDNQPLIVAQPQKQRIPQPQPEQINLGFFPGEAAYNEKDIWLDDVLRKYATAPAHTIPTMV